MSCCLEPVNMAVFSRTFTELVSLILKRQMTEGLAVKSPNAAVMTRVCLHCEWFVKNCASAVFKMQALL